MNIDRADLNLLRAFDALLSERSVSRAAVRLGIGQPAASNALARLRSLFEDELFVRDGRTMVPTPRALELAEPIGRALAAAREALEPPSFDPARAKRVFTLSAGDYALATILPDLVHQVRQTTAAVDLRVRFVEKDRAFDFLDDGRIDLALGVFPEAAKRFCLRTAFEEQFVCLMRRDHPLLRAGLTVESYAAASHVLVTERGDERGVVDDALAALSLKRRIALTVPNVLVIGRVLLGSDLVATTGARMARIFAADPGLALVQSPIAMPPWRMHVAWLRRRQRDAGLAWLLQMVERAARSKPGA
jgi:DNA-binding transcriptional LysR family regulator